MRHAGAVLADNTYLSQAAKDTKGSVGAQKNQGGAKGSEEDIFGGEDTVTPGDTIKDDSLSKEFDKKSVTFTGFLNSRTSVNYKRASILRDMQVIDSSNFLSYFQSNFGLDVRLPMSIRGYFNLSADYYPAGLPQSRIFQVPLVYLGIPAYLTKADLIVAEKVNAVFSINEVFLDVNIARYVYFRLGKQVVKWGVGYLWTPTDLINIEKKNILDSSQVRQGTYGLKIHVPFGTRANIYSFINMNNARHLSDISMANKVEVLFLNTEMALSVLLKNHNVPVYGFDFTSRVLGAGYSRRGKPFLRGQYQATEELSLVHGRPVCHTPRSSGVSFTRQNIIAGLPCGWQVDPESKLRLRTGIRGAGRERQDTL